MGKDRKRERVARRGKDRGEREEEEEREKRRRRTMGSGVRRKRLYLSTSLPS